jgi:predicted transglutaminase-like cysteine proteinase
MPVALKAITCAIALWIGSVSVSFGTEVDFDNRAFMPAGQTTSVPVGAFQFCRRHSAECTTAGATASHADLSEDSWAQLQQTNNAFNLTIRPVTDLVQYGAEEHWTYPDQSGDCEDYVLAKRRELLSEGWPASTLMVAVVRRPDGEGHAVLVVRTDRGDLVLDNLRSEISLWVDTPYEYVKQSASLASWVSVR